MIVPGRLIGTVYATSGTLALRVPSVVPPFFLVLLHVLPHSINTW